MIRFLFINFLCFCFLNQSVMAAGEDPNADFNLSEIQTVTGNNKKNSPDGEYVFQPYPGAVLIPVYLWGAVVKAGIYRVPLHTNLVTLISLAGGPMEGAELDNLSIRRFGAGNQRKIMLINAEDLLKSNKNEPIPGLEANDIIYLPKKEPWISSNTVQVVSIISMVLSIVVSVIVIKQINK